jgi:hypothetical protein
MRFNVRLEDDRLTIAAPPQTSLPNGVRRRKRDGRGEDGGSEALHKLLESAAPDVLREILTEAVTRLMGLEVDALCGAGYGERSRSPSLGLSKPAAWTPRRARSFSAPPHSASKMARVHHATFGSARISRPTSHALFTFFTL